MNRQQAWALIESVARQWADDDSSDVVWAGEHEGRLGIRMAQRSRDFTTVWFDVGDITVRTEAYLTPAPPHNEAQVYRLCAMRSFSSWPMHIAADPRGDIYVVGRIALDRLSETALDEAVGSVYELVDLSFRKIIEMGFQSREKEG